LPTIKTYYLKRIFRVWILDVLLYIYACACTHTHTHIYIYKTSPSDSPVACWGCVYESRWRHGLCCKCCDVWERFLLQVDHSSRGVLPSVVCPTSAIAKLHKGRPWYTIGSKRLCFYTHKKEQIPICGWSSRM
jgi:hypothetical protein